ncbi:hypothetical protein BOTBODRAFT_188439 [Botryobasidium botryosum FD-172 SS1]|uniref:Arrestin-like N-terminal domain-containing protein n=1 Tax=Botryobasidium botryosum (strain FD-172 SS1) TaxID=930990 RepID=A0A067MPE0_BOTB1|nr:hypothetical protein BOTBODRAFT_188439 [Botryobasidium botryosum FD-172 SS1]
MASILSALGITQPTLRLTLQQSFFFLHPNSPRDLVVRGYVVLGLPKPKEIKSITVRLVGHYNVLFPDSTYETGDIFEKHVTIDMPSDGYRMQKGEHSFAFTIPIPHTCAPYERCRYGRTWHRIYAVAKGPGLTGDVTGEAVVELVANPSEEGETQALDIDVQGFADYIGPHALTLRSQHFTVASLVQFSLSLPSISAGIRIQSITATIAQRFRLRSMTSDKDVRPPVHRRQLFCLDGTIAGSATPIKRRSSCEESPKPTPSQPLRRVLTAGANVLMAPLETLGSMPRLPVTLRQGSSFFIEHVARMPNDDNIRPTTQAATRAAISTTHDIEFEVRFDRLDDTLRPIGNTLAWKVMRPITISSCCCMLESVVLPSYTACDPLSSPLRGPRVAGTQCSQRCVCGATIDWLIEDLVKSQQDPLPGYSLPYSKNDGIGT